MPPSSLTPSIKTTGVAEVDESITGNILKELFLLLLNPPLDVSDAESPLDQAALEPSSDRMEPGDGAAESKKLSGGPCSRSPVRSASSSLLSSVAKECVTCMSDEEPR